MVTAERPAPRVYVFYDYVCPYAYLGKLRMERLHRDHDVDVEWLPWEIYPTTDPEGEPVPGDYPPRPVEEWLVRLADEMDVDLEGPDVGVNSNLALRGAEVAKDREVFDAYHDAAYDAIWQQGRNIGDPGVLAGIARKAGMDPDAFLGALEHNAYQARLDAVDRAAVELGIQRVPTFVFGDQRIVGNDPFEASLRGPLEAFLERWKALGDDLASELSHDTDLETILIE